MIFSHCYQVVSQADAYPKLRTEFPETGKYVLHSVFCHRGTHQIAISQCVKQFVIFIVNRSKCLYISPLHFSKKCIKPFIHLIQRLNPPPLLFQDLMKTVFLRLKNRMMRANILILDKGGVWMGAFYYIF